MINKKFRTQYKQGFTLIETLAAILLLSLALAGPMTIAQKGLSTALISKDQNTAFNLAQDAVEYIRFARDTNCLVATAATPGNCPAASWLTGTVNLANCITPGGTNACLIDSVLNTTPVSCAAALCTTPVNYDSTNNYFTTAAASGTITPTIFTRSVQIQYNAGCTTTCNAAEADITVTVSWNDPVAHSIQVKESLYNWQ